MGEDTTGWARCTVCHAVDVDEFVDGPACCQNCGALATRLTDPPGQGRGPAQVIYPLLCWSWAPCQACGETGGEQGEAEDRYCLACGTPLMAIKRRVQAEGFPVDAVVGNATEETSHRFAVGERGVYGGPDGVRLVGADPFTLLQVIDIRPNGDLDVAATHDGSTWVGVPVRGMLHLAD